MVVIFDSANQYPEYPASSQDPALEGENDRLTDELKGKIHKLKSVSRVEAFVYNCHQNIFSSVQIVTMYNCATAFRCFQLTIEIGSEVRDQNGYLKDMVILIVT